MRSHWFTAEIDIKNGIEAKHFLLCLVDNPLPGYLDNILAEKIGDLDPFVRNQEASIELSDEALAEEILVSLFG